MANLCLLTSYLLAVAFVCSYVCTHAYRCTNVHTHIMCMLFVYRNIVFYVAIGGGTCACGVFTVDNGLLLVLFKFLEAISVECQL